MIRFEVTNNNKPLLTIIASSNNSYTNNLSAIILFQLFQSNTNNFQTDQFDPQIGPLLMLPLWVRVDLWVIKGYSTISRAIEQEPHQFSVICRTPLFHGVLPLCRKCSWHVLSPANRTWIFICEQLHSLKRLF